MTKEILLASGEKAIVDDANFDYLMQWSWHGRKSYGARCIWNGGKPKVIYMHHEILKPPSGLFIDHINGNPLDNRRCNLRICTHSQNLGNRSVSKTKKGSRYKGVTRLSAAYKSRPWQSMITCQGRHYFLGNFAIEEDAARAYDAKAKELFGEFAHPNFE